MSKYIIKNCPAYDDIPNMYDEIYGYCKDEHDIDLNKCLCENITDCLLKKIVEKLKNPNNCRYSGRPLVFTAELLQLIEIEECE